jgi:tetratricopeptide (TPR) repeat protein
MAESEAKNLLLRAHELHGESRIDEALASAREAIALQPGYVDAWSYLGTTLITRKLAFAEGLAALEQAEALAPEDAGIVYGLGWCYEFVAYRLERQPGAPYRDPIELYRLAGAKLQRCIDLNPEAGLREDAEDLRAAIEVRLEARGETL